MSTFKFQPGLYTVVLASRNRTTMMEMVVSKDEQDKLQYKVKRKIKNDILTLERKSPQLKMPTRQELQDWLIFEGHDLHLLINTGYYLDYRNVFRFTTFDPAALKAFIITHCKYLSTSHLARVVYDYESSQNCKWLYRPRRILHSVRLYDEREVFPGIYFAICQDGHGVLHDKDIFHASAYLYVLNGCNYRVHIHHNKFHPERVFQRSGYQSQESAITGLLFHASRIFELPIKQPIARREQPSIA